MEFSLFGKQKKFLKLKNGRCEKVIKIYDVKKLPKCFALLTLVYWFDRLEKQQKGDKISVFFEMTGAGLSNMDMEFVQYLIMLFRDYYPYFLNYIIIFEMSWILNGTFKNYESYLDIN